VKKSVLWAACGVAAVAVGFVVARRASSIPALAGAARDGCVGQPTRYARLLKPRLRLNFPRRSRD